MGRRVRDFLRTIPNGGTSAAMLDRLEELLAGAELLMARQEAGLVERLAATRMRNRVRRELNGTLLRALVASGVVAAEDTPGLVAQFRVPGVRVRSQTFVIAARRMLARATGRARRT